MSCKIYIDLDKFYEDIEIFELAAFLY